jgi:hypothetical protein
MDQLEIIRKPDQVSFKKIFGADEMASERYAAFVEEFKSKEDFIPLELL